MNRRTVLQSIVSAITAMFGCAASIPHKNPNWRLETDAKRRSEYYAAMLARGKMDVDEIRRMEGLPTLGETHVCTNDLKIVSYGLKRSDDNPRLWFLNAVVQKGTP